MGLAFIFFALSLIIYKSVMIEGITTFFSFYVMIIGLFRMYEVFRGDKYQPSERDRTFQFFVALAHIWFAAVVFALRDNTAFLIVKVVGVYQLIMGILNMFSFHFLRMDEAEEAYDRLLFAVVHLLFGLGSIFAKDQGKNALVRLGIYTFLVGLTFIHDGRAVIIDPEKEQAFKRQIRVPLPAIFSTFLPQELLRRINNILSNEIEFDQVDFIETVSTTDDLLTTDTVEVPILDGDQEEGQSDIQVIDSSRILSIAIHVGTQHIDVVGHMNAIYQGKVYSFGNHDVDSRRLFDAVGDGVLVIMDSHEYLDFTVKSGTTVLVYDFLLSEEQEIALKKKLAEIEDQLTPWIPKTMSQMHSYAGRLLNNTSVSFYKFSQGQFQTYFVFWTNCVLFTDEILGVGGTDIFSLVGVQTPGTYYDYFEKLLHKDQKLLVRKRIFNAELSDYLEKEETSSSIIEMSGKNM